MANSIKFDNTELNNTTYYTRFVKHESFPERELNSLVMARNDGDVFISERFGKKVIELEGILVGTSQADLESKKDIMSELFARLEKNLDIDWNGATRRYVASCEDLKFDRDHYNIFYVPWSARFVVFSGIGEDPTEVTIVNADTFTANYKTKQITLLGSAEAKMRFSIAVRSPNNTIKGIELKNTDTGERIYVISASSLDNKTVEIDSRLKTVKIAGVEVSYYGTFPRFVPGVNNIQISAGDIIDQQFAPLTVDSNFGVYGSIKPGQSFMVPYSSQTYKSIWVKMAYTGSPAVGCKVRIETDSNGLPSGTLVDANAEGTISSAGMSGGSTATWYQIQFPGEFSLQANTRYHIVEQAFGGGGGDSSNCYLWYYESGIDANYKLGNAEIYTGSWAQESDKDMIFKLCFGGTFDSLWTQTYSIFQTKRYL